MGWAVLHACVQQETSTIIVIRHAVVMKELERMIALPALMDSSTSHAVVVQVHAICFATLCVQNLGLNSREMVKTDTPTLPSK